MIEILLKMAIGCLHDQITRWASQLGSQTNTKSVQLDNLFMGGSGFAGEIWGHIAEK